MLKPEYKYDSAISLWISPLGVSSSNNIHQLISYNKQLPVVKQYLTNNAAIQNVGVLWQIWFYKIIMDITDMSKYHGVVIWSMD